MRPRRWQPTRLLCSWDSPGKNTGVGCHFLLQCRKVKSVSEVTQLCLTPRDPMDGSLPGSSIHGIFQARVLEWGAIAFPVSTPTFIFCLYSVQFSRSVVSKSLWPHESQHARPPCPSATPGVHSNSCPSSHLILSSPSSPASNPSQHQSLSQWVNFSHEVAKICTRSILALLDRKSKL